MKARSSYPKRSQYEMPDPWGIAQGDREDIDLLSTRGRGYWIVEKQPAYGGWVGANDGSQRMYELQQRPNGEREGPPYRRIYLTPTGKKVMDVRPGADYKDDPELKEKTIDVQKLRSRYGYLTEDLTTKEMRRRWIAGGRIKIIDLQNNEVLAERTGYFRALGSGYSDPWSSAAASLGGRICPANQYLHDFLFSVLKPVQQFPTIEQLQSLEK